MKTKFSRLFIALVLFTGVHPAAAQGTAFTYQGRLNSEAGPANGSYDFRFRLAADPLANNYLGSPFLTNAVAVSNGLFTTPVNFGPGIFTGSNYWLEVDVKTNLAGAYETLAPLQPLTPAPYAVMANAASNLLGALPAAQLSGAIANGNLPASPSFSGTLSAGSLAGNGANVTNVNAATVNGLAAANFWQTAGNSASTGQFLGSANNQPLELRVNSLRALRLEPGGVSAAEASAGHSVPTGAPNVIGGSPFNFVTNGVVGATIAGGGATNYVTGPLNGPGTNSVTADFGTVGGGLVNTSAGVGATVAGGIYNSGTSDYATVSGGLNNQASDYGTVGGGSLNASSAYGTVAGGRQNTSFDGSAVGGGENNQASGLYATVAGGSQNAGGGQNAAVGGGHDNQATNDYATVGGGYGNTVGGIGAFIGGGGYDGTTFAGNTASGPAAVVVGGLANTASGSDATVAGGESNRSLYPFTTVGGGEGNTAGDSYAAVGGGNGNTADNEYATVGGGTINHASGYGSFIGGGGADGVGGSLASGYNSFIGGGAGNLATNDFAVVGGGYRNTAGGVGSFVGGGGTGDTGSGNLAGGLVSVVGGGAGNQALNSYATVPGGYLNIAGGASSFAAGQQAQALQQGAFVWADSQNAAFASTANDQFLIRAQGGVGIGTASPATALHVVSPSDCEISIESSDPGGNSRRWTLQSSGGSANNPGTFQIIDRTASASRLLIDTAGNVGIGTPSPSQLLTVAGNICASGTIGACSDARFKEQVQTLSGALAAVSKLRGVNFLWKTAEFPEHHFAAGPQLGFIAQEVRQVLPQLVAQGSDGYFSVDYSRLTPVLVEAIKEQQGQLQAGDAKIAGLEEANTEIRRQLAEQQEFNRRLESRFATLEKIFAHVAEKSDPALAADQTAPELK